MTVLESPQEIREVNRRYHDVAAEQYDAKWGIGFGDVARAQVLGKLEKGLGSAAGPFERALEVGAGTGYFALNLVRAGMVRDVVCTDISPAMLGALEANATRLGMDVETAACDAAALPYPDESFDLVFGHAVLHHLPELDRAFAELVRVLRPGGTLFFAGEPSRTGDRLASVPKRLAFRAAPAWRRLVGARPAAHWGVASTNGAGPDDHILEPLVDVHAFVPADLERHAFAAGLEDVRVRGEELLANWFGWTNRTLEATADPASIPWLWVQYAYRGYLLLQAIDRWLLEPRLPASVFYNLMVAARKTS
jgi:ubiquinone/menaquinone biosynthesis C-methylase UbiE